MTWKNPSWIACKFTLTDWGLIEEKGQQHSVVSTHSETLPKVHCFIHKGIEYPHNNTKHSEQLFCLVHPHIE